MEVIIADDQQQIAVLAAALVAELLDKKPTAVLGLATGNTPLRLYRELIRLYVAGKISFKQATTFNLDEYLGVDPASALSYRRYMQENFFEHIDIEPAHTHLPDGMAANPRQQGPDYEQRILRAGGIDLQVLGIGRNGHIGFNEPGSSLASRTRIKTLASNTRRDNGALLPPGEVMPKLAITMGVGTILQARRVLLLAQGEHKAVAVAQAVEGPLAAMCPASALQLHPHVTVLLDEASASKLQLIEYYRHAWRENQALKDTYGNFYELDIYRQAGVAQASPEAG